MHGKTARSKAMSPLVEGGNLVDEKDARTLGPENHIYSCLRKAINPMLVWCLKNTKYLYLLVYL